MKLLFVIGCSLMLMISLAACNNGTKNWSSSQPPASSETMATYPNTQSGKTTELSMSKTTEDAISETSEAEKMQVQVGRNMFTATLSHNAAADSFVELMQEGPILIKMRDHAGFEKVGSLGTDIPTSDSQMMAQAGDIVLYNGNQIVVFYGSNFWSYTKLGQIDDLSTWEEALGSGNVTIAFSVN